MKAEGKRLLKWRVRGGTERCGPVYLQWLCRGLLQVCYMLYY